MVFEMGCDLKSSGMQKNIFGKKFVWGTRGFAKGWFWKRISKSNKRLDVDVVFMFKYEFFQFYLKKHYRISN